MRKPPLLNRCRNWVAGGTLICGIIALLLLNNASAMLAQDTVAAPTSITAFDTPTTSSPISLSADKNHIWVVNPDDGSVSVLGNLDATPSVLANITNVGREPQSVALDIGNGAGQYHAYIADAALNSVTVITVTNSTPSSMTIVPKKKTIVTGAEPYNIVTSPDGKRVFVANSVQDTISVIDTSNQSLIGAIDIRNSVCNDPDRNRHFQPRGLAVTLNNDRLYVTRFLSFIKDVNSKQGADDGKVGVVCQLNINTSSANIADYAPARAIAMGSQDTGFPAKIGNPPVNTPTHAYPNQLQSIVIRGEQAYLPNIASSTSGPLKFDVDTEAFVNVLDGVATGVPADASATKFLNLHLGARTPETNKTKLFFANPWAIAFTNQSGVGNGYVVSAGSDLLVKVNVDAAGILTFTGGISTTHYIDLNDPGNTLTSGANARNAGKNPLGIVIRNNKAFVMNYVSRNVSIVDLDTDELFATKPALALTSLPNPGSQDEQIQVGKEMFFASRGRFDGNKVNRLSQIGWQNCASCHFAGLTDGNIWTFNSGPRKSVPLNGTWSPHNPDDQRLLNYSAIFDEVQDFELNIRNVSGPGPLSAGPPVVFDPNHGLIISDTGSIDAAPAAVPPLIPIANAGRKQLTVTLPGSSKPWPALDSLKEWVRFNIRTPNGALTTDELTTGGGLDATTVRLGRRLFFQAGCQKCHGGTKWTISSKDFTSPPAATEVATEADTNGAGTPPDPNAGQFLPRFLSDIKSYNLNVAGVNPLNQIPNQPLIGAVEKDVAGKDALGLDFDGNGKGAGFNIPSLLAIWDLPPYYHNGACETLNCVLANPTHRKAGQKPNQGDPFDTQINPNGAANQAAVVEWLKTLDADTPFPLDLRLVAHDLFLDPPTVLAGQPFTIGVNVSLFGTKPDLVNLLQDLNITNLTVRFQTDSDTPIDVTFPASAFSQNFGQATVVKANLTAPAAGIHRLTATIDPGDQGGLVPEDNENNNSATRNFRVRTAPTDRTPPTVSNVLINNNDAVTQSPNVKVTFKATDLVGSNGAQPSGVASYCIVTYYYDIITRRWVEETCTFQAVPQASPADTFVVDATLPNRAGTAYAFVWVKDAAGNISHTPGFDTISFVPATPIDIKRNDVRIFRISLAAGQNIKLTLTPSAGDVDVSVFDDFTNPNANRIAVSANNGTTPEEVTLTGPGKFQVQVHAVVNSIFTVAAVPVAEAATTTSPTSVASITADETPLIIAGPPALQAAIDDDQGGSTSQSVYLPIVNK
ncbi:MAG: hypothetical protein U0350_24035 [Caldilineaceae bacterium]